MSLESYFMQNQRYTTVRRCSAKKVLNLMRPATFIKEILRNFKEHLFS